MLRLLKRDTVEMRVLRPLVVNGAPAAAGAVVDVPLLAVPDVLGRATYVDPADAERVRRAVRLHVDEITRGPAGRRGDSWMHR